MKVKIPLGTPHHPYRNNWRCYLLESLRYTSLLLYDVTPVSQRKHNILIPILDWVSGKYITRL